MSTRAIVRTVGAFGMLQWGACRLAPRSGVTEARMSLPGDNVLPHPMLEWNRGVSIAAAPQDIWPWPVQLGYGRAGYYTPPRVDRWANQWVWRQQQRFPYRASPWRLLPGHRHLAVGGISPTRLAGPLAVPHGLVGCFEGMGMLHGMRDRFERRGDREELTP